MGDVPNGVSATPFIWEYLGAEIPMMIYGGFAGCEMDGDYIRPVLAWAVGKNRHGVFKNLVRKWGEVETWTTEAVCEYLTEKATNWPSKGIHRLISINSLQR